MGSINVVRSGFQKTGPISVIYYGTIKKAGWCASTGYRTGCVVLALGLMLFFSYHTLTNKLLCSMSSTSWSWWWYLGSSKPRDYPPTPTSSSANQYTSTSDCPSPASIWCQHTTTYAFAVVHQASFFVWSTIKIIIKPQSYRHHICGWYWGLLSLFPIHWLCR